MYGLSSAARMNFDGLCEVKKDLFRKRGKERLGSTEGQLVQYQNRQVCERAASAPVRFVALPAKLSRPMGVLST